MRITSLTNPRIKKVVALRDRQARRETGLTVIDGIREGLCAVEAGVAFEEVYFCRDILQRHAREDVLKQMASGGAAFYEVTPEVFQKISFGDRREGVVIVCRPQQKRLDQISVHDRAVFVVVEGVEKPGNLGAILRTADGAGVDAILVSGDVTDMFNPNVIRASLGTAFSVPVVSAEKSQLVRFLKEHQVQIVATSPGAPNIYWEEALSAPLALVVGSEQKGLNDFWMTQADSRVRIPMAGRADSLNVSATLAILLYDVVRRGVKGTAGRNS